MTGAVNGKALLLAEARVRQLIQARKQREAAWFVFTWRRSHLRLSNATWPPSNRWAAELAAANEMPPRTPFHIAAKSKSIRTRSARGKQRKASKAVMGVQAQREVEDRQRGVAGARGLRLSVRRFEGNAVEKGGVLRRIGHFTAERMGNVGYSFNRSVWEMMHGLAEVRWWGMRYGGGFMVCVGWAMWGTASTAVCGMGDVGYVVPEVWYVVPQVGYVVPQVGYVVPQVWYVVPQVWYVVPQVWYVVPQVGYDPGEFCHLDDYNWDRSMWELISYHMPSARMLRWHRASAWHFGEYGLHGDGNAIGDWSGMGNGDGDTNRNGSGFPRIPSGAGGSDEVLSLLEKDKKDSIDKDAHLIILPVYSIPVVRGDGGWGDGRDIALCLQIASMYT
ncbi:unnamed protein product [Closterium sp. NIES-54]